MKVEQTVAIKLVITGIENLDPVVVYLEDLGPSAGKATVTCFNDSWSYFWGSMGAGVTIRDFLLSADKWYVARKFAPQLNDRIDNTDGIEDRAKEHIIERRRDGSFSKEKARELWDDVDGEDFSNLQDSRTADLMYSVFGDEWWECIPKQANPKWEYLLRIVDAMKAGISSAIVAEAA